MAPGLPFDRRTRRAAASLAVLTALACSTRPTGPPADAAVRHDRIERTAHADIAPSPDAVADVPAPPRADAGTPTASTPPVFTVRADGAVLRVRSPDGGEVALDFVLAATTLSAGAWSAAPRSWARDGADWSAVAANAEARWTLTVRTDPARPVLVVGVDVAYLAPVEVRHEELAVHVTGATGAEVLGRDLALRTVEPGKRYVTDPWTPLEARATTPAGPITVLRAAGFPSAVTAADADGLTVHLELDDAGNHPYRPYASCYARYSPHNARDELDGTPRLSGERAAHAAALWLGDVVPLRAQRFPAGRRAAVVFTSHADQSTVATTGALLWGDSDPAAPDHGSRGFLGHGLTLTLAAFAEHGVHADLADPAFAGLLRRASDAGVEVCPHSVTSRPDDRTAVARLLPRYAPFAPATWIDHQPDTNCEAVMNLGGRPGRDPTYFALDLLRAAGLRYLWNEPDLEPPGGTLDMLGPRAPDFRPAILFRNGHVADGAAAPWMFRTVWMFEDLATFLQRLDDSAVQRLIDEHGILLAHVYLDTYQPRGRLAGRSLLEPSGEGFRLRDDADELLRRLAEAQADGRLWVTTVRALADHLIAAAGIRATCRADGTFEVTAGDADVGDAAFAVPVGDADVTVDGAAPRGLLRRDGETVFWLDIPRGRPRTITLRRGGRLVPCGAGGSTTPVP